MTNQAQIIIKTKDVIDVPNTESLDPQHSYIIAKMSDGTEYILRAGPSGFNAFTGDLEFKGASELLKYGSDTKDIRNDWPKIGENHSSTSIFSGSDAEVMAKFNLMRAEASSCAG